MKAWEWRISRVTNEWIKSKTNLMRFKWNSPLMHQGNDMLRKRRNKSPTLWIWGFVCRWGADVGWFMSYYTAKHNDSAIIRRSSIGIFESLILQQSYELRKGIRDNLKFLIWLVHARVKALAARRENMSRMKVFRLNSSTLSRTERVFREIFFEMSLILCAAVFI